MANSLKKKSLVSLQNLVQISRDYGHKMKDLSEITCDDEDDIFYSGNYILELCEKLEKNNDNLFNVLRNLQDNEQNSLNLNPLDAKIIEGTYLPAVETFHENLKNVYENMELIKNSINDHLNNETIKMDIEYQKLAPGFLDDMKSNMIKFQHIFKNYQDLVEFTKCLNSKDLFNRDNEFVKFYEKLNESNMLLLRWYKKANEIKKKKNL